ncbi:MAG: DUF1993 domain-containing protein [Deltaproteobacteria bacterium]|nr:DUF1993 domain-containing protein [Deltaproteobacteria bacterium]
MNLYDATVPVFTKFLQNIDKWLDKAVANAEQRKFDPETLLVARLAPNQFALLRQIQIACDNAKVYAAKLANQEAPSHPDTETTIAEVRARLRTVIAYLATFKREDFEGADERLLTQPRWEGKMMRGGDYLDHYALPNIHFHLTTAYAILRHNGVELGKSDYLGEQPYQK